MRWGFKMKPYEILANEIVMSAVNDYKTCLEALKKDRSNISLLSFKRRTEDFFYSEHFHNITNIDPNYLIKNIKERI